MALNNPNEQVPASTGVLLFTASGTLISAYDELDEDTLSEITDLYD